MFNKLIEYLSQVADIHLISRLKDERLEFPYEEDVRIFLPDMHFISNERAEKFKYGTNYPDLIKDVAEQLLGFKNEVGDENNVVVYQLGDFLDPWRETPSYWTVGGISSEWEASIQKILDDNAPAINQLRHPDLETQFVFGNHDIDLRWLPAFSAWKLRYYFPIDPLNLEKGASIVALHGDILKAFEKQVPDWLQYLAVYLFGGVKKPSEKDLGKLRKEIIKAHNKRKYTNYIHQLKPSISGEFESIDDDLPERHNVKKKGESSEVELKYLQEAKDFFSKVSDDLEWDLRVAIIGHTHHARIAIDETGDQFFALVDCGAWIERCKGVVDGEEIEMENAQIGVLSNNDVRIYQLRPKEG